MEQINDQRNQACSDCVWCVLVHIETSAFDLKFGTAFELWFSSMKVELVARRQGPAQASRANRVACGVLICCGLVHIWN